MVENAILKVDDSLMFFFNTHHRCLLKKCQIFHVISFPVVLDTLAFQPDGSPHYVPFPKGWLPSIVNVLAEWIVEVIGLRTEVSYSTSRGLSHGAEKSEVEEGAAWEKEAADLGLPMLVARVGRTLGGTGGKLGRLGAGSGGGGNAFEVLRLEDVLRLLIEREDEEASGRLQLPTTGEKEGPTVVEETVPVERNYLDCPPPILHPKSKHLRLHFICVYG